MLSHSCNLCHYCWQMKPQSGYALHMATAPCLSPSPTNLTYKPYWVGGIHGIICLVCKDKNVTEHQAEELNQFYHTMHLLLHSEEALEKAGYNPQLVIADSVVLFKHWSALDANGQYAPAPDFEQNIEFEWLNLDVFPYKEDF